MKDAGTPCAKFMTGAPNVPLVEVRTEEAKPPNAVLFCAVPV
jgi:hypothetical protein